MLDLTIAPKNLSADMEVSQVWDATQMQHRAIFVWAYPGSLDYVLELEVGEKGVVGHRLRSWKLADTELASFRDTN